MTARDAATERQVDAARPDASTWLSANAGSGKTRVLTDRVARLLLNGTQPQRILCLTYTKAAAGEMQNRLFRRLGEWAMLDDATLRLSLDALGVEGAIDAARLREARTLFARAIETPGGLKIQTIHSFCASLLRRFPLEAGVSPQFSEIEDRAAALLRNEVVDDLADGPHRSVVQAAAHHLSGDDMEEFTSQIVNNRAAFQGGAGWQEICALFDLPPQTDEDSIAADVFDGTEAGLFAEVLPVMRTGKPTDIGIAERLSRITRFDFDDLPLLEAVFLTGSGAKEPFSAKVGAVPTKDARARMPTLMPALNDLMLRLEAARTRRIALGAARKTLALHRFAASFLPEYERRKQLRGWLDFDDLIQRAQRLLNDPRVAQWVLYRLDGGIDHILVDEAQDTSPVQWDVIEKLAQEFTSGLGARDGAERTIFVVGDKKQSIYSFQGADPGAFDRMQADFDQRLAASGTGLKRLTLEYSFRSADSILRLVDVVFRDKMDAGFPQETRHKAFHDRMPGRVDLWPAVDPVEDEDDRAWYDPLDRRGKQHHSVVLARRIAGQIRHLIDSGETIPDDKGSRRPLRAGDFLILVQRRSDLFAEIIRACKAERLPIAGADRLKVGAELAVRDLAALLSFLATPEDDLSLATVLRSPLAGWTEKALFDLAHPRGGAFLWEALRERATEFPETLHLLNDMRGNADFLRPYDLIERVLTRHDGRRRLIGRLGHEAEDGINALLSQALAYERSDVPSLTGFLTWLQADDLEIKRQIDGAGNMVRVMTVHGAKGLESPVVILPDTAARSAPREGGILLVDGLPVWSTPRDLSPAKSEAARQDRQDRQIQERQRLLYVALTRAEKWLIVAAAGKLDTKGNSWFQQVEAAMQELGAEPADMPGGAGLRLSNGTWDSGTVRQVDDAPARDADLPDFLQTPAQPPAPRLPTLSPSDMEGGKALSGVDGQDEEAAKARGTAIHLLLEQLPNLSPETWPEAARRLVGDVAPDIMDEVTRVLRAPALAHVFAADALTEVPFTTPLAGRRLHGKIDRLIVTPAVVTAVDFKSNAVVPASAAECPEGLLRQMGAYAHALAQIFPDHRIETAFLWTRTAELMTLPHQLVTDALWRTPHLDAPDAGS